MVEAPVRGYPYAADVELCFYRGKLAAIHLIWPSSDFRASVTDWQLMVRALAGALVASYAPGLVLRNSVDDDTGALVE